MAWVQTAPKIGDSIRLREQIVLQEGYFERGSILKLINKTHTHYYFADSEGNGWYTLRSNNYLFDVIRIPSDE